MHYWLPSSFTVASKPKVAPSDRPLRFIYVGWMIKEKGVSEILSAIGELRGKFGE